MSTLQAEFQRLYPSQAAAAQQTCTLVLELARPADWSLLSPLWRGVQSELELPAPAIAVNGKDGFQLWFSLTTPVPLAQARAFLDALRGRYVGTLASSRIGLFTAAPVTLPALLPDNGHWSAFIAPDLAAIFSDEPWLDLPPNPQAQALVLGRIESTKPAAFQAALEQLTRTPSAPTPAPAPPPVQLPHSASALAPRFSSAPSTELQPRQFLQAVMNDTRVELHLRIEAAKALLPYSTPVAGADCLPPDTI